MTERLLVEPRALPTMRHMRNGNTFGRDAQYGSVGPGTLGARVSWFGYPGYG